MVGIGFFAPFPLALMIPFMAGQSLAMGEAFGKGFQYGKRKISSMSNEEFNKLDFRELSESLATDYRTMIPSLTQSIKASDQLQKAVFEAFGDILGTIPAVIKDFMSSSPTSTSTSASELGKLTEARYTPSRDREGDLEKTNAALAAARKALEDAYAYGSAIPNKPSQKEINEKLQRDLRIQINKEADRQTKPSIRVIDTPTGRKAGQSQIIERNRLYKLIAQKNKELQLAIRVNAAGGAKSNNKLIIIARGNEMKNAQLLLTSLLKRYRF